MNAVAKHSAPIKRKSAILHDAAELNAPEAGQTSLGIVNTIIILM